MTHLNPHLSTHRSGNYPLRLSKSWFSPRIPPTRWHWFRPITPECMQLLVGLAPAALQLARCILREIPNSSLPPRLEGGLWHHYHHLNDVQRASSNGVDNPHGRGRAALFVDCQRTRVFLFCFLPDAAASPRWYRLVGAGPVTHVFLESLDNLL